ncbi:hypothetical protein RYX36_001813 [Vicia faba]
MLVASLFGWYYHGYHACSCMACGNKLPFECEASHLTEAKIFRCNYSSSDICCSIENYNLRMRGAFGFICCSVVSYNDPGWNS